jgi:ribosome-binding factor A
MPPPRVGTGAHMGNDESRRRTTKRREREPNEGARVFRLQELIREELNLLLRNEIRDGRLDEVSITIVELTGDGSCARLWFSADEDRALEALEGAGGFLRSRLAESLGLKRTPELRFRRDPATRAFERGS